MALYNESSPILSIIVPIYNSECFLEQCLTSIRDQTFENWECWLVDDGSTDTSGKICDEYGKVDSRFKVIHKTNEGLVNARITGIKASKGTFIGFVDSDDWIEPDMYENMIFGARQNSSVDIVVTGIIQESHGSKYLEERPINTLGIISPIEAVTHMLTRRIFAWELWCKIYKRSLFDKESFAEILTKGEDLYTTINVFKRANKILCLQNFSYHYRLHPASMSHTTSGVDDFSFLQAIKLSIQCLRGYPAFVCEYFYKWYFTLLIDRLVDMYIHKREQYTKEIQYIHQEIILSIDKRYIYNVPSKIKLLYNFMSKKNGLVTLGYRWEKMRLKFEKLSLRSDELYIFGTGYGSELVLAWLEKYNIKIDGFLVSDAFFNENIFHGYKVVKLSNVNITHRNVSVIIGALSGKEHEIRYILSTKGYGSFYWPFILKYILDYNHIIEVYKDELLKQVCVEQ